MKTFLQSTLGFVITVITFIAGGVLTDLFPATRGRYMSPLGELMVGVLIFITTLSAALILRFKQQAMLFAAGLTLAFEIAVLAALSGSYWWGDFVEIWPHTFLPVALSSLALVILRSFREKRMN